MSNSLQWNATITSLFSLSAWRDLGPSKGHEPQWHKPLCIHSNPGITPNPTQCRGPMFKSDTNCIEEQLQCSPRMSLWTWAGNKRKRIVLVSVRGHTQSFLPAQQQWEGAGISSGERTSKTLQGEIAHDIAIRALDENATFHLCCQLTTIISLLQEQFICCQNRIIRDGGWGGHTFVS